MNGAFVRASDGEVDDGDTTKCMRGKEATVPALCCAWSPSSRRFSTALEACTLDLTSIDIIERY